MNKKFISVFMIGAATLASLGTVTSCKDYDDDINDLQERLDGTGVDLKSEVSKLEGLLSSCKEAYEKADTELNETIKNATNDAKGYADIQAAEAKKAAVEASQTLIEQAIADLEAGAVKAAQTKADAAYSLAEQVQKTAADNEKNIAKIVADLATAKDNLEKADKALEKKLSDAEKKIKTAQDGVDKNSASIVTLEKSLTSLKESNEKALAALSDKDDELKKLIDDNQDAIKKLLEGEVAAQKLANEAFDAAIKANAKAVKDLAEGKVQDNADAIAKITERVEKLEDAVAALKSDKVDVTTFNTTIESVNSTIESVKGLITTLETGKVKDNADAIAALKGENGPIQKNAAAIQEIVDVKLENINKNLKTLTDNLNNLITGLILQDEQLEIVQAQVVSDVNKTGLSGKTFTEVKNGKTFVIFPYKGAAGADANTLIVDQWNVERVAGPVYYTINPTDVNFTNNAKIDIENSLGEAPAGLKLLDPKVPTRKTAITRVAEESKAPKNGLYQSIVENNDLHRASKHGGFNNSYALFTRYKDVMNNGKWAEKRVYSKYALNINVVDAAEQTTPSVVAVKVGECEPSTAPTADARYTAKFENTLQCKLKLGPVNTEFGKTGATPKVYRKYVEAIAVSNARNVAQTGAQLTNLLKAINNYEPNSGVLNTIFEEDDANFDYITVNIPDTEGDYSFIGSTVTFRYYIQNYNGTIYSKDYKVMFTKHLFQEKTVTIKHMPYQSGVNTTKNRLTKESQTEFQTQANCMTVPASNKLWTKNTAKIVIEATGKEAADKVNLKSVEFYSDSKIGNGWVAAAPLYTATFTNHKAEISGLTENGNKNIKNMIFTYDPKDLVLDKDYELTMTSFDENENEVSVLIIKFKMVDPKCHAKLIKPNPMYFTPFDENLTAATLEGKTLTAWANYHVASAVAGKYDAKYNIIQAFNPTPTGGSYAPQADGCVLSFDYTDKVDYVTTDPAKPAKYAAFKPVNDWRLKWNTAATDYTMTVPAAAVSKDSEHPYNLQVAVEEFGVPSLWCNPIPFKVVFKSAIAYTDLKFSKDTYEIGYPNDEIVITDDMITAVDPSDNSSVPKEIKYFNNSTRDDRIKDVKIVLKETDKETYTQFASLFSAYSVEDDGIHIHTSETIPGGVASITSYPVKFQLKVTDYYENTVSYDLKVQVKKNN